MTGIPLITLDDVFRRLASVILVERMDASDARKKKKVTTHVAIEMWNGMMNDC